MKSYKASVIVPVYNTGECLKKCLSSLRFQTLRELEIIIIDDGSTDDISSIVDAYKEDLRIKYRRLPASLGPGGARNAGLEVAEGAYIGFCDSDDWVDFNFYEAAVNALDTRNADIAMFTLSREYDVAPPSPVYKCKYDDLLTLDSDVTFRCMTYQYNMGVKVIPPCTNKVYRHSFLKRLNARFPEKMYFQDVFFSFITILNADKILCIPGAVYHHYRRPNSIIQSFDTKHTDDFAQLFRLLRQLLTDMGLYETYRFNYYKLLNHFYGIIVREIFEFVRNDTERKEHLAHTFRHLKDLIVLDEYLEHTTAEELRQHLLPNITDTTLY